MKRSLRWLGPVAGLVAVFAALVWLFSVRLGGGDLFPEYSSLRADPLGTRALYEALEALPGFAVERELRPFEESGVAPRLVVFAGVPSFGWERQRADQAEWMKKVANNGGTVVIAYRAVQFTDFEAAFLTPNAEERKKEREKKEADAKKRAERAGRKEKRKWIETAEEWELTMKVRALMPAHGAAMHAAGADESLPASLPWPSDLYFVPKAGSPWRVIYRRSGEPVVIERALGRGRIVLMANAYVLSNEAVHKDRGTAFLTWLVGNQRRATFVESALGVREETGVGHLARRYGLGGALALLLLLGALYLWQRAVAFYPVRDDVGSLGEVALRHEPAAGMTALLRRSLGRATLLTTCVQHWREARRGQPANAAALARFDAAWQARVPEAPSTETYNSLVRALKPR